MTLPQSYPYTSRLSCGDFPTRYFVTLSSLHVAALTTNVDHTCPAPVFALNCSGCHRPGIVTDDPPVGSASLPLPAVPSPYMPFNPARIGPRLMDLYGTPSDESEARMVLPTSAKVSICCISFVALVSASVNTPATIEVPGPGVMPPKSPSASAPTILTGGSVVRSEIRASPSTCNVRTGTRWEMPTKSAVVTVIAALKAAVGEPVCPIFNLSESLLSMPMCHVAPPEFVTNLK